MHNLDSKKRCNIYFVIISNALSLCRKTIENIYFKTILKNINDFITFIFTFIKIIIINII